MNRATKIVWGGFAAYFLAFELPAAFRNYMPFPVPWITLSRTAWDAIQETNGVFAIPVVGGLEVLKWHLVAPKTFDAAELVRRAVLR